MFAWSIPDRKPHVTIKPPIGANNACTEFRFKPILVSIIEAKKIVIVEIMAEINKVVNDKLGSNTIIEYISNGIGINKMNSTAKNTPTADLEF